MPSMNCKGRYFTVGLGGSSWKGVVFALRVAMLELLSGKEAVKDEVALYESVEGVLGGEKVREKLREFMDQEYPLEVGYAMGELARRCVARHLDEWPPVSEVFVALSNLLSSALDEYETSLSFS